jgi:membrane protein implicated in regulation of membrane protease activity
MDMQRFLIIAGAILLAAGLLWPWLGHLGLGRLPGDIAVERPHFRLYFPWVTCLVISVVLTLLIWLFRK